MMLFRSVFAIAMFGAETRTDASLAMNIPYQLRIILLKHKMLENKTKLKKKLVCTTFRYFLCDCRIFARLKPLHFHRFCRDISTVSLPVIRKMYVSFASALSFVRLAKLALCRRWSVYSVGELFSFADPFQGPDMYLHRNRIRITEKSQSFVKWTKNSSRLLHQNRLAKGHRR